MVLIVFSAGIFAFSSTLRPRPSPLTACELVIFGDMGQRSRQESLIGP